MTTKTIHLIQFAHTDLGYTHPLPIIESMYLDHYRKVVELCEKWKDAPPETRFRWTAETLWQVETALRQEPELERGLKQAWRNGQIEFSGTYLHFTDLIGEDLLRSSIRRREKVLLSRGFESSVAIHTDINGYPWILADLLAEMKTRLFISIVHEDSSITPLAKSNQPHYLHRKFFAQSYKQDLGVRLPQFFYWEGPGGGRVLTHLAEHYMNGNMLGLSGVRPCDANRSYWQDEHDTPEQLLKIAEERVPEYLALLDREGYPYPIIPIFCSGYMIDNAAPSDRCCAVADFWNARHDDVKIRISTPTEMLSAIQPFLPGNLPVHRAAWPDHWAHGLGSATVQVSMAMQVSREKRGTLALLRKAMKEGAGRDRKTLEAAQIRAEQSELLALEHTFGSWDCVSNPGGENALCQASAKMAHFGNALMEWREVRDQAARMSGLLPADPGVRLTICNPDGRRGAQLIEFPDHWQQALNHNALRDASGRVFPVQRCSVRTGSYLAVVELDGSPAQVFRPENVEATLPSNLWDLNIRFEPASNLLEIRENGKNHILLRGGADATVRALREEVIHPMKHSAVSNQHRDFVLGRTKPDAAEQIPLEPRFRHDYFQTGFATHYSGSVFEEWAYEMLLRGEPCGSLVYRRYRGWPVLEVLWTWNKQWNELPEAAYLFFQFPFAGASIQIETAGGAFTPFYHGANGHIPGTCAAYFTVQGSVIVKTSAENYFWTPLDAPLAMLNDSNFTLWKDTKDPFNGTVVSMPVNHYWRTNFAGSQRGRLVMRYRVTPQSCWPAGIPVTRRVADVLPAIWQGSI